MNLFKFNLFKDKKKLISLVQLGHDKKGAKASLEEKLVNYKKAIPKDCTEYKNTPLHIFKIEMDEFASFTNEKIHNSIWEYSHIKHSYFT